MHGLVYSKSVSGVGKCVAIKKKVKPLEEAVGTIEKRGALSDFLVYRNVQSIK